MTRYQLFAGVARSVLNDYKRELNLATKALSTMRADIKREIKLAKMREYSRKYRTKED